MATPKKTGGKAKPWAKKDTVKTDSAGKVVSKGGRPKARQGTSDGHMVGGKC